MKVEKIDIVWSVLSVALIGWSFRHGRLPDGLLIVYGLMVLLFLFHIYMIRRRFAGTVAVYGTISDYHQNPANKKRWFPIVKYETEGGTPVTAAYPVQWNEKYYEIGSEEMICYDPDDTSFFYFAGRENELTQDYFKFILFGSIAALLVLIIKLT